MPSVSATVRESNPLQRRSEEGGRRTQSCGEKEKKMKSKLMNVFLLIVVQCMMLITAIPVEDEIKNLPDYGPPPFRT